MAVVRVMVQSLWGGATGAVWVGEGIDVVGYSPAVGAPSRLS